ncbi:hypothetical protein [Dongia sp.]|uniref:hypothetical protein n=1 Tax=Dongia sp. TaxID=1977262 RepID=UPI0035B0570F
MRKLFVTLLTFSLLGGLFLTGALPMVSSTASAMAATGMDHAMTMSQPADCDHHAPKQKSDHSGSLCCTAGHCPLLGQFMPPATDGDAVLLLRTTPRPVAFIREFGIAASPGLRPPRLTI